MKDIARELGVAASTASQALRLKQAGVAGTGGLPCLCMQLLPGDPGDLEGVRANFAGVGEMAVRLCDMGIRQNRFGLPASPTMTQVRPRGARSEAGRQSGWAIR